MAHTAILKGLPFRIFPAFTNTGAVTLRINTLAPIPLLPREGGALQSGDTLAGVPFDCVADGLGNFRLLGIALQQSRTLLAGNLQLYVDPRTGADTNNGLSWGTAYATAQGAWNAIANRYDLNGFQVFVNLAKGTPGSPVTHTAPLTAYAPPLGSSHGAGAVIFVGDTTTPDNVVWGTTGSSAIPRAGRCAILCSRRQAPDRGRADFRDRGRPRGGRCRSRVNLPRRLRPAGLFAFSGCFREGPLSEAICLPVAAVFIRPKPGSWIEQRAEIAGSGLAGAVGEQKVDHRRLSKDDGRQFHCM